MRAEIGAVGREVYYATKEGASQIRRRLNDATVIFVEELVIDI
jgi:hypothetical protein